MSVLSKNLSDDFTNKEKNWLFIGTNGFIYTRKIKKWINKNICPLGRG